MIISEDLNAVVKDKIKSLAELHRRTMIESGYNEGLAYRLIVLCLTSEHPD